jgi:hypothetical protein
MAVLGLDNVMVVESADTCNAPTVSVKNAAANKAIASRILQSFGLGLVIFFSSEEFRKLTPEINRQAMPNGGDVQEQQHLLKK